MIRAMYEGMERAALVDGQRTASFPVDVGVSQGSVLSPFLYSVFIDGLLRQLKADPENPDGWVRLVRAYAVLGDTVKRDDAYASARARYAGQPQVVQQLDEAARAEPMQ